MLRQIAFWSLALALAGWITGLREPGAGAGAPALSATWLEAGGIMDPNGRPSGTDEGGIMDTDGRPSGTDAGGTMDPNGG